MKRGRIVALAGVLALALLVLVLATRVRRPPPLPRDATHALAPAECESCHGPDGPRPRSRNHPVARDCLRCHGPAR